jgi:ABC-2 type transport system ATP-binding protein
MPDAAKARLGYVAQKPDLPPWLTVRACCDYVGAFYPSWDANRVSALVQRWELDPGQRVGRLSGGQAQALAVVLALGHAPELLVLDEPASALDPIARRRFLQTLAGEVAGGTTVVFSTHLTADLERVADRIAILAQGRVVVHEGLDALRGRVRRLRCPALGADSQPERWPGVVSVERQADGVVLVCDGGHEAIAAQVVALTGVPPAIDELGLEDLVIGYQR